jgi:tetratricopeptide (TPR) repeat protein
MSKPLVSAALIVKNEERFLEACLASLQGVVDEIVVVDTGSVDRSKAIAQRAGARVGDFVWIDDFAAARNHGLSLCTGEWILYIDADERVRPGSAATLQAELSNRSYIGYEVLLHPVTGYSAYRSLRLFKNDPSIRFVGVIHENIWPAMTAYRARNGGEMGMSRLILDHSGYEDNREKKNARNLPLLLKYLEREPSRIYCWCHLANIYKEQGHDLLAEQAWNNALSVIRRRGPFAPDDAMPYHGLIEHYLQKKRDARPLLEEALSFFPRNPRFEAFRGQVLLREGKFQEAIQVFQSLISRGAAGDYDNGSAYDLKLFTVYAWDALATCYFRMGDYAESRRYYAMAVEHDPDNMEFRVKQSLCSRLAAKQ